MRKDDEDNLIDDDDGSLEAAEPAFRRYGKSIGWHLKKGPHSITHEDWRFFMDYARNTLGW